jgi:hypothetical protein
VAVFDLAGAFGTDDADGLIAAFREGRSLNALARPLTEGQDTRFLVSRGPGDLGADVLRHERWPKLIAGFRDAGALLIMVVPLDAPGIEMLGALADRAVDVEPAADAETVATNESLPVPDVVAPPGSEAEPGEPSAAREPPAPMPDLAPREPAAAPRGRKSPPLVRITPTHVPQVRARKIRLGVAAVAGLLLVLAGGGWYLANRNGDDTGEDETGAVGLVPAIAPESLPDVPAIANPDDSALASLWSVEIITTNDRAAALAALGSNATVSAATIAPLLLRSESAPWFKVIAGAFRDRAAAEYLRATLRQSGALGIDAGVIARAPLALRLETGLAHSAAKNRVSRYVARGIPAYALAVTDNESNIYVGAFAGAHHAVLLLAELRAAGLSPDLAYRVGRTF